MAALSTVCFFSLIVLGVSAYLISLTEQVGFYYTFMAFAVAIAALTLITFPPLLIISFIRKGALFNYIIVEVGVLGLFWVLWLATASYTANTLVLLPLDCNFIDPSFVTSCHELQAIHAFSWLNWLILTAYWPFLLVMALIQQNRGNPVWTKSVGEVDMFAPGVVVATQVYPPQQQQPVMYSPQPMQQHPQMGYPPNAPGTTYSPVPTQGGYTPTQPQVSYAPTPTHQPQQHAAGGYPQV
ncbi:hypothetical protein M378DRAFT_159655 [Amanita muscaria Koide BX008]|uniref:MARVEL domain-containing protein n=1 Tax=Amanita muscaria (strain Koide BX008) TaxID=946122 RepID=A0A0C2TJR1_AMAMK|nr:hypothetical protein M378DRAFT_159655 [Amanita muscaria Koide BX008]